jgi:hypothetical protein
MQQNIKHHWDSVAFNRFLKEVEGYLMGYMQIGANAKYTRLAADYYAKGRTPGYCAYALARHAGVWRPF